MGVEAGDVSEMVQVVNFWGLSGRTTGQRTRLWIKEWEIGETNHVRWVRYNYVRHISLLDKVSGEEAGKASTCRKISVHLRQVWTVIKTRQDFTG